MTETDVSLRIKEFARRKGLKPKELEQICGLANDAIRKLRPGSHPGTFQKIKEHFPDFDIEYARTGQSSEIPEGYTHPMVTDSAVVKETMASHYSAVHQNVEHDMLIKSTTMIDSMKAIVKTIDDPSLAINLIGQILGVTPPQK